MDGIHFTEQDRKAAHATPACRFDTNGDLVRFTYDKRDVLVRDVFVPSNNTASWKRQGEVKPVEDRLPPGSEDRVLSFSRRFILLYQDGNAKLYDLFTGEQKEDPWLTKSFADARKIKDLDNVRLFLTDDLNHLVVSPTDICNYGNGHRVEDFNYDGKTYKRSDFGLAYNRPDSRPLLFPRKLGEAFFHDEEPSGAYSIDGTLFLFMKDIESLRLSSLDGSKEFHLNANGNPQWPTYPYLQMQQPATGDRLIIFESGVLKLKMGLDETLYIIDWKYKANEISTQELKIGGLFKESWGEYKPLSTIGVK